MSPPAASTLLLPLAILLLPSDPCRNSTHPSCRLPATPNSTTHPPVQPCKTSLQLVDHPFIKPGGIHSHEVLEGYSSEYLYLAAVKFVKQVGCGGVLCFGTRCFAVACAGGARRGELSLTFLVSMPWHANWLHHRPLPACLPAGLQVKKGPLQETSPMLVDISGIPMWSKVGLGCLGWAGADASADAGAIAGSCAAAACYGPGSVLKGGPGGIGLPPCKGQMPSHLTIPLCCGWPTCFFELCR
jgi:hypothetical protein